MKHHTIVGCSVLLGLLALACGDPKGAAGAVDMLPNKTRTQKIENKGVTEDKSTPNLPVVNSKTQVDIKAVPQLRAVDAKVEQAPGDGSVAPAPQ